MKINKKVFIFLNLLIFVILWGVSYLILRTCLMFDVGLSANNLISRSEFDMQIIKIREIVAAIVTFFSTTVLDFYGVDNLFIKVKKYRKTIFLVLLFITIALSIGLYGFYIAYPL